jgi:hypothetical protein
MGRFIVIIFEQCHDQYADFWFDCHCNLPFDL